MTKTYSTDYSKTLLKLFLISLTSCLFLIPLLNAWSFYPFSYVNLNTSTSALGGMLPWSDATGYFSGANTLLNEGSIDCWNTRRPLNVILFSLRLWLTDYNFKAAIVIQALLAGFCCLLVASRISETFGKISGFFTLLILFAFASVFIPTTLSEILGLTLGCLGFILVWEGVAQNHLRLIFASGIMLTVALNTRAGPFFILPCIILWLGFKFNKASSPNKFSFNWQASLLMTLGILIGFLFSWLLTLYGDTQNGAAHSNFALTLYGIVAGGKTWAYAYQVFPEFASMNEAEGAKFLYLKSWLLFKENPSLLLLGLARGILGLLKALLSFFQFDLHNPVIKILLRLIGSISFIIGLIRFKKLYSSYPTECGLLGACLIGMLLSSLIIWTDGGFRVFAVGIPFVATTFGIIVGSYFKSFSKIKASLLRPLKLNFETQAAMILSAGILLLGLFWPLLLKTDLIRTPVHSNIQATASNSNPNSIIAYKIAGAPHIELVPPAEQFKKALLMSSVEAKDSFLRIIQSDILNKPMSLGYVYDLNSHQSKYIMGPTQLFTEKSSWVKIHLSNILDQKYILKVESYEVFNEK